MGCSPSRIVDPTQITGRSRRDNKTQQNAFCWSERVVVTESQKKLVAKSFYNLQSKLSELGVQVFYNIFTLQPELKSLFGFKDKKDEDLEYDMDFRNHAARFMAVVGCAIESLSQNDDVKASDVFHRLGAQHLNVPGFQQGNFNIFKEALLQGMAEQFGGKDKFKGELYRAWDTMVKYIIQRLQDGYMEAKNRDSVHIIEHHTDHNSEQGADLESEDRTDNDSNST